MTKERLHESQLRNVRKWAESKPHMYGSSAIIDLIDELMERRAADTHEPCEWRCVCGELKVWAYTTRIETATTIHRTDGPCYQREQPLEAETRAATSRKVPSTEDAGRPPPSNLASRDAKSEAGVLHAFSENCPKCNNQMTNWAGRLTKCTKCLHEWYMDTLRT